jgi:DNA-binding winged helix-turn-helix (wHTH) protein
MARCLRFDEFTYDGSNGGIWHGTKFVSLRPKTLAFLLYLAENPSRLLTKDEIAEAVWPGLVATDESIAKCVSEIRAALGNAGHLLLKTAPKRGYIFEAAVLPTEVALPNVAVTKSIAAAARPKHLGFVAALLTAIGVFLLALVQLPNASFSSRHTDPPSIAVLPFSQAEAYLGEGLAEDLTATSLPTCPLQSAGNLARDIL